MNNRPRLRYPSTILLFMASLGGVFCQVIPGQPEENEKFLFNLKSMSFFRNNEYSNPVIEGYTLTGYFLQPSVLYLPSDRISIRFGTHILGYSGAETMLDPKLVFSTTWRFSKNSFLTLGSLNGTDLHRMEDPLFNIEKLYTDYAEEGIQLVFDKERIFSDTWIHWQNFIFKGDTTREVFIAGESFSFKSKSIGDLLTIETPVQVLFKHYGGQISNYSSNVITYFNGSAGLKLNIEPAGGKAGKIGLDFRHLLFRELTMKEETGFTGGKAWWLRLGYELKPFTICAGYWNGDHFFAPEGNQIYSNLSDRDGAIIRDREMITGSLFLKLKPAEYFDVSIGLESFYDPGFRRIDSSLSVHLFFNRDISLSGTRLQ